MKDNISRRNFITIAAAAATTTTAANAAAKKLENQTSKKLIIAIACSSRKGKTTSQALQVALDAAEKTNPAIETCLLDLGGMNFSGWQGGAKPSDPKEIIDDFTIEIEPILRSPNLSGMIIGSPVYFRSMSSICKAFLERLASLRTPQLLLKDKLLAALSVGAYRNGGQELVIERIHAAMLCHEVMCIGGKPKAHQGATLWNAYKDDIHKDEFGITSAKNLGTRIAEAAILIPNKH